MFSILFCDSNFFVGYVFHFDSLHKKVKTSLLKNPYDIYYSQNVKEESNKVFIDKMDDYQMMFSRIQFYINKNNVLGFISLNSILDYFSNKTIGKIDSKGIKKVISHIWNEYNLDETIEINELKTYIRLFKQTTHKKYINIFENIFQNCFRIPNHIQKDDTILNMIEKHSLKEKDYLHDEDIEILFDAHEYAKNNTDVDLIFVSADNNFVYSIKVLMPLLSFKKYININEL